MAQAVNELAACDGGQVVVKEGRVIGKVALPIAGLMSDQPAPVVAQAAASVLAGFQDVRVPAEQPQHAAQPPGPGGHPRASPLRPGADRRERVQHHQGAGGGCFPVRRRGPPTVALLTDFGTQDVFVGVLKGVIARMAPAARVIDLTHEIPPGDIRTGALRLWQALPFLPPKTVVLAVVDPGVGTARKADRRLHPGLHGRLPRQRAPDVCSCTGGHRASQGSTHRARMRAFQIGSADPMRISG